MLDHQQVEAARIGEDAAHHQRVGDRLDPVGKAERPAAREPARLVEQPGAAEQPSCGGHWPDFFIPSCPASCRASTSLLQECRRQNTWMAGTSPAMTG